MRVSICTSILLSVLGLAAGCFSEDPARSNPSVEVVEKVPVNEPVVAPATTTSPARRASPGGSSSLLLEGSVEAVNDQDNLVVLSVGEDQGIQEGMEFEVRRDGEVVGRVQVTDVYNDLSGAKILESKSTLQVRDRVRSDGRGSAAIGGSPLVPPGTSVTEGWIEAVNPLDGFVVLSAGSQDGVVKGQAFSVFRANEAVGRVQVVNVYDDLSGARIVESSREVRVGDRFAAGSTRPWRTEPVIQEIKSEEKVVMLSVGKDDVRVGEVFPVCRSDEVVGEVKIVRVFDDVSAAKIVEEGEKTIQVGDGLTKMTKRPVLWSWPHKKRRMKAILDGFHKFHEDTDRIIFDMEGRPLEDVDDEPRD